MGRFNRTSITFEKTYLDQLKENSTSLVYVQKTVHHLALHPFHLTDVNKSVKEILNEGIAKYNKSLNGILLGYQNIKLFDSVGGINYDNCFIHLDVEAEFYLFKPEVGNILNGIVNKKSRDHIGCLVHQIFNVSIPKPEGCEKWLGRKAQLGHEVQFKIIFINLKSRLPYIKAVILSILSDVTSFSTSEQTNEHESKPNKIIKFDSLDEHETPKKKISKKKRKKHLSECLSETSGTLNDEYVIDEVINNPKKRKKHKATESNEFDSYENVNGVNLPKVDKKKKSKKNKNGNIEPSTVCEDVKKKSKKSKKRHQEDGLFKDEQESFKEEDKLFKNENESFKHIDDMKNTKRKKGKHKKPG